MKGKRGTDSRIETLFFISLNTIQINELYEKSNDGLNDELFGCLIGVGSLGSALSKQLKHTYQIPIETLSTHSSDKPETCLSFSTKNFNLNLKDKLWNLVILVVSSEDPSFSSTREIVLSYNPDFLWTIVQTPKGNPMQDDSLIPTTKETISIINNIDSFLDDICQLITVIYSACYQVNSIIGFDMADLKGMFAGRLTSLLCFRSKDDHRQEALLRFIDHNKKFLLNTDTIHLGLIYKEETSFTLQEVNDYTSKVQSFCLKESCFCTSLNVASELGYSLCATLIMTLYYRKIRD